MNEIDGKNCFSYEEVAEITGYSPDYVEKCANGQYDPDLREHKKKMTPNSAFITEEGVRQLGTKDEDESIDERIESFDG